MGWSGKPGIPGLTELLNTVTELFGVAADIRLVATAAPRAAELESQLEREAARVGGRLTLVRPRYGKSSVDIVLAVEMMEAISVGARRLVLASADADLAPVIPALKRAGIHTAVMAPPETLPLRLSLAADEPLDMNDPDSLLEGLIRQGSGEEISHALKEEFARALREIVIIDPYVDVGTIRLLSRIERGVEVTVIGSKIGSAVRDEAGTLREYEWRIRLLRLPAQQMPHDRWFRIDE